MLLPQDIVVAIKLVLADKAYTFAELANALGMSSSQVHSAVNRCRESGLVSKESMQAKSDAVLELAIHGVKYVYPAKLLPRQRGMPTAHSAAPLKDHIRADEPIVWPDSLGDIRGEAVVPIHKSVPGAARKDEKLYQALALVDAIRIGRSRERELAIPFLNQLLGNGGRLFQP